jgi:hypothetical protein
VGQERGEPDLAGVSLNRGGLDGGDLMLAQTFADDIEAACQRSIAEARACSRELRRQQGRARRRCLIQRPYFEVYSWALTGIRASRATREVHSASSTNTISPNNDADK